MIFYLRFFLLLNIIAVFIFSSCKKIIVADDVHVKASWIKVLPDTLVTDNNFSYPLKMIAASDGGMYLPWEDINNAMLVARLDADGNLLWKRKLKMIEENVSLLELSDHSLFALGTESNLYPDKLFWYKISSDGEFKDSAEISCSDLSTESIYYIRLADNILVNDDGTMMVYGWVISNSGVYHAFTCLLNSNFQKLQSNAFVVNIPPGANYREYFPSGLQPIGNGKYLMTGEFVVGFSGQSTIPGIFSAVLNSNGEVLYSKYFVTGTINNYSFGYYPKLSNLFTVRNGNFSVVQSRDHTDQFFDNSQNIFTLDTAGNIIDTVPYFTPTPQIINCAIQKPNGDFLMMANDRDPLANIDLSLKFLCHFLTVNNKGEILQYIQPQSASISYLTSCCKLVDGSYAAMGFIQPVGKKCLNIVVIKTDENGYY